jgi:hypothetical protein
MPKRRIGSTRLMVYPRSSYLLGIGRLRAAVLQQE